MRPATAKTPCPAPDTKPARYFPLEDGRYRVSPGLFAFPRDFGNGEADRKIFQIDREFPAYRAAKLEARGEQPAKYCLLEAEHEDLHRAVASLVATRLAGEYPDYFRLERSVGRGRRLRCALSGEELKFDRDWRLLADSGEAKPAYSHAMDALACQCQEDMAWIRLTPDGGNRVVGIHLCYPNHWSARDKIGRDFISVHQPVAGIDAINRAAGPLLEAMVHKGPYVRFAWGIATDTRLNHHPEPPPGIDASQWRGRRFDPARPRLYVRVERQVMHGLPEHAGALFTIRVSFVDVAELRHDPVKRAKLVGALRSMSPETLRYKGLHRDHEAILAWLSG